jgi:hypothetical protein
MISHFKEKGLPPAQRKFEYSERQASVEECDILTFGDSYFEFSRHKQFPERLADDFNKEVHYVNNDYPLDYLQRFDYHDTIPKLVIFERVERYIPIAFEHEHQWSPVSDDSLSQIRSILKSVKDKIFYDKSEELYDAMLKRSYLTTSLYGLIATIKFDMFGYISKLTPSYLVNEDESWLFYHDQVNHAKTSFYYDFSQDEMDSICDHMADLSRKLKEKYNMDLVYLPLPAKYTLYHDILNHDTYNNFLPRLYDGLDKRNVKYVNVFDAFENSNQFLYYRTDDHWNEDGIQMAYRLTLEYIFKDKNLARHMGNQTSNSNTSFILSER